jgi:hypothetical protein
MSRKKSTTPSVEHIITENVMRRLCINARQRARALRSEARPYWLSNRKRMVELKAEAAEFDRLALMLEDCREPNKLRYPANAEEK